MLKQTEDRKELSTSTEIEGEGEEDKMVRKATGQPVRQEKKDVSPCRLKWLNLDLHLSFSLTVAFLTT